MSWVNRVQSGLVITTGDGKSYEPKWMKTSYVRDYNVTEYNFPETDGTLVKRTTALGTKYSIEIFFEGDENIEDAEQFRISSDDRRPWTIEHPEYGNILVQPSSLSFDTSVYNSTRVTGTVTETIADEGLQITEVPLDLITGFNLAVFEISAAALSEQPNPNPARMAQNNQAYYDSGRLSVSNLIESERYFAAFSAANGAIANVTAKPLQAAISLQRVIEAPAQFSLSVRARIDILRNQLTTLIQSALTVASVFDKKLIETNGSVIISAMSLSAATPLGNNDYGNADTVFQIIEILLNANLDYTNVIDSMQTVNGGDTDSYVPDFGLSIQVNDVLNYTISSLFTIALSAQQLRTFTLTSDTSLILLAHKFYGLNEDDSTIDDFILQNSLGLNDMLILPAGKIVKYYV